MVELKTLARGKVFHYEGSIKDGIEIKYGKAGYVSKVSMNTLQLLLNNFEDKIVPIQATRTVADLNEGSLGYWLNQNINGPVITSYIAAILVHEGCAEVIDNKLKFKNRNNKYLS